ncbi:acyl-CoA thioesterase [Xanthobacter versatilis]|uniref:acyl-CoA thioesterase n=1 Tax=Xanthobacter autotrophicus (strain ATCC BAA-1158 / Py2) TaxID=78245 RepID=UPI0037269AA4
MIPWFRTIRTVVAALCAPRLPMPHGRSVVTMRVWPNDLDLNLHMNNGRYLTLMDLGRTDLLLRAGLGPTLLRERWMPVITGAVVRYRRSLALFQRFHMETAIIGWTGNSIFIEHRLVIASGPGRGEVAATATIRGALLEHTSGVRKVEIVKVFAAVGLGLSDPLPDGTFVKEIDETELASLGLERGPEPRPAQVMELQM